MAKTNPRSARIAAVIQRVIATALSIGLHDPRLKSVTVTEVRVTNDMQIARIFWTQLGDPGHAQGERKRAAQALRQATGHLRTLVGRSTGLRLTPQLEFVYDEVPAHATAVEDIMVAARHRDEQLARLRENARYAGEEDPYRHGSTDNGPNGDETVQDGSGFDH
ncbi:MAG: 30S ribosome-binding factor RbfA [Scardovia wiggsiae]